MSVIEQTIFLPGSAVFLVQGRLVVLGMLWEPLESNASEQTVVLRTKRKKGSHYFVATSPIKKGERELGIACALKPEKNYYSGALLNLTLLGSSWLGLFKVTPEHYWVVAAIEGQIVPASDVVFKSGEEARSRFEMLENLFAWEKKFFEIEDATGSHMNFKNISKQWRFADLAPMVSLFTLPLRRRRFLERFGFGLGAVGLLGSSFGWIHDIYQRKLEGAQVELQKLAEQELLKNSWKNTPPAKEFLETSMQEMLRYPLQQFGWRLSSGTFDGQWSRASYKKTASGTHQRLVEGLKSSDHQVEISKNASTTATLKKAHLLVGNRSQEVLPPLQERCVELQTLLERGLLSGKLEAAQTMSGFKYCDFSFSSNVNPQTIFSSLPLEGLSFKIISFSITNSGKIVWNFSGRIYGV